MSKLEDAINFCLGTDKPSVCNCPVCTAIKREIEARTPDITIDLDDGKYTIIHYPSGKMKALRHGEEWRDLTGDNLIYFMALELNELRQMYEDLYGKGGMIEKAKVKIQEENS